MSKINPRHLAVLIVLSFVFFMLGNGLLSLTNPNEAFYSQTAKEMQQRGSWMVPYLFGAPQFEKPVLTYWLIRIGFILFGVTNFGARFFPALFGMIGVLAVYIFGTAVFKEEKKSFLCALALMSAGLYIGLSRTVFTDIIFSVFILLALVSFYLGYVKPERKGAGFILFFVFSGLAVLTKGPLGLLLPAATALVFLAIRKDLKFVMSKHAVWGLFCFTAVCFPWYVYIIKSHGSAFTREFFYNDHIRRLLEAEHKRNDTWYFYPMSMIGCMFPWSIFTFAGLIFLFKKIKSPNPVYLYLACWIAVVFAVFQSAHSKLTSYILPMFPALAVVTGDFIYDAVNSRKRILKALYYIQSAVFLLLPVSLLIAASVYSSYIPSKAPVYILVILLLILGLWAFVFLRRGKFFKCAALFMFPSIILLYFSLFMRENIEPYVSSKGAAEYLINNHDVKNTVLASRSFARGVRFYTDRDIAVINIRGRGFFSPHPIPYLDTDEKALDFLKTQDVTYGVLRKSAVEDLYRVIVGQFTMEELKKVGDEYVVRIKKIQ